MAYTVTRKMSVFGDQRVAILDITADAATQTVETGMSKVNGISLGQKSLSTAAIKCYVNSNASGVQSFGVLGISGCASGDQFFVIVYGE